MFVFGRCEDEAAAAALGVGVVFRMVDMLVVVVAVRREDLLGLFEYMLRDLEILAHSSSFMRVGVRVSMRGEGEALFLA